LILVVEDDPGIATLLTDLFESSGYEVRHAATAADAHALSQQTEPSLIVLDLVLPDDDGLVLCSILKQTTSAAILICSGTQRRRDALLARKLGADDFVAKPFDAYDLLARVEALLRRAGPPVVRVAPAVPPGPIHVGELVIDQASHVVRLRGTPIELTPTEYRLLTVLASRTNEVVSRDALAELVWGDPAKDSSRTIDVHIGRLRVKLAPGGGAALQIVCQRGFGYKLIAEPPRRPIAPPREVLEPTPWPLASDTR
jgi:DNA-binding response OmpR family regulator